MLVVFRGLRPFAHIHTHTHLRAHTLAKGLSRSTTHIDSEAVFSCGIENDGVAGWNILLKFLFSSSPLRFPSLRNAAKKASSEITMSRAFPCIKTSFYVAKTAHFFGQFMHEMCKCTNPTCTIQFNGRAQR